MHIGFTIRKLVDQVKLKSVVSRVTGWKAYGTAGEQLAFNFSREEGWSTLPIVEKLRKDVKRWRETGYRNATNVTRQLLRYWQREGRQRPLFFCQLEAVETIILYCRNPQGKTSSQF